MSPIVSPSRFTETLCVVGATGLLGSEVARALRAAGYPVRALVRTTADPGRVRELEAARVETRVGDLKEPASLEALCHGVDTLISTASSSLSRQGGDTLETVDRVGHMDLIGAAVRCGVRHVIFISFPPMPLAFPLQDAKREVEACLRASGLGYTILLPTYFIEVWMSPAMGFDPSTRRARLFGDGGGRHSWVSLFDVRDAIVSAVHNSRVLGRALPIGGGEYLGQEALVRRFESLGGCTFAREFVPLEVLERQYQSAIDPLEHSFAALCLHLARGGELLDMTDTLDLLPYRQRIVDDFVRAHATSSAASGGPPT